MKGWLGIAAVVVSYDTWAAATMNTTLSHQFKRAAEGHPLALGVATTYLVMHLWGLWPRRVDPFCGFCWLIGSVSR